MSISDDITRIRKQYDRGIITKEEAVNKIIDILIHNHAPTVTSPIELENICQSLNEAGYAFDNAVRDAIASCTISGMSKEQAMDLILKANRVRLEAYDKAWDSLTR